MILSLLLPARSISSAVGQSTNVAECTALVSGQCASCDRPRRRNPGARRRIRQTSPSPLDCCFANIGHYLTPVAGPILSPFGPPALLSRKPRKAILIAGPAYFGPFSPQRGLPVLLEAVRKKSSVPHSSFPFPHTGVAPRRGTGISRAL